jgi:hypothetical protein
MVGFSEFVSVSGHTSELRNKLETVPKCHEFGCEVAYVLTCDWASGHRKSTSLTYDGSFLVRSCTYTTYSYDHCNLRRSSRSNVRQLSSGAPFVMLSNLLCQNGCRLYFHLISTCDAVHIVSFWSACILTLNYYGCPTRSTTHRCYMQFTNPSLHHRKS